MNVLSLFDGMSCGQIALDELNIKVDNYFAAEIKGDAIKCTKHNYPGTIHLGDVRNIKGSDLPNIDLLIGGSPCQDFSQANKNRDGLEGAKSGLFWEYKRLLDETSPTYFFLENVAMESADYAEITNVLGVEPIEINSLLVSAQSRNRVYWTDISVSENLIGEKYVDIPQPQNKMIRLNDILDEGYYPKHKARTLLESDSRPLSTPVKMFHRFYSSGFTTLIFKSIDHYLECEKHYNQYFKGMPGSEIEYDGDVYNGLRYMNQSELERCQTVPSGYTSMLTRNQAAGLLGDGWTVDVIKHIFSYIERSNQ